MPIQTTLKTKVIFKDGAKVQIKTSADGSYVDIGAVKGQIALSYVFDKEEFDTANAGDLDSRITNMKVDGSFNLLNFDPANLRRLSSGLITQVDTLAALDNDIANQTIAALAATDKENYDLVFQNATTLIKKRASAEPIIASVTGGTDGPLTVDDDFTIVSNPSSNSGYSIMFNIAGTNLTTMDQEIVIVITSIIPIAVSELFAGSSAAQLETYALKFTHTNSDTTIDREFELFATDINSGGLQFNFGGADEEGYEEAPIAFSGKIDSGLVDGRQLFRYLLNLAA